MSKTLLYKGSKKDLYELSEDELVKMPVQRVLGVLNSARAVLSYMTKENKEQYETQPIEDYIKVIKRVLKNKEDIS